jgi:hypothetical protein
MSAMIAFERWKPLSVAQVAELFASAPFDWCLAGGLAIEQFVGVSLREHGDIDVVVFRDQQLLVRSWLATWRVYAADPPGELQPWPVGELLAKGIHDIWLHLPDSDAWQLQLMIQDASEQEWIFRRDHRIRGDRQSFIQDENLVPCIRPEIQLLYKAPNPLPKDEIDFRASLPLLSAEARTWLRSQLELLYPAGHPWSRALGGADV